MLMTKLAMGELSIELGKVLSLPSVDHGDHGHGNLGNDDHGHDDHGHDDHGHHDDSGCGLN